MQQVIIVKLQNITLADSTVEERNNRQVMVLRDGIEKFTTVEFGRYSKNIFSHPAGRLCRLFEKNGAKQMQMQTVSDGASWKYRISSKDALRLLAYAEERSGLFLTRLLRDVIRKSEPEIQVVNRDFNPVYPNLSEILSKIHSESDNIRMLGNAGVCVPFIEVLTAKNTTSHPNTWVVRYLIKTNEKYIIGTVLGIGKAIK